MSVKDPYKARKRPVETNEPRSINDELPKDIPRTSKVRINKSKSEKNRA
jgi:hypothetical protein